MKYYRIHYNEKYSPKTTKVSKGITGFDAYCRLNHPPMGYKYVTAEEITELEYKAERL